MKQKMIDQKSARVFQISRSQAARKDEPVIVPGPSHDEIAKRAHEIYVEKGRESGRSEEDWHQAESDLRTATRKAQDAGQEMQNEGGMSQASQECGGETPAADATGSDPIRTGAVSAAP